MKSMGSNMVDAPRLHLGDFVAARPRPEVTRVMPKVPRHLSPQRHAIQIQQLSTRPNDVLYQWEPCMNICRADRA